MTTPAPAALSERALIVLVAAIQFVNVLDFMMVTPLGPDFAVALGIPTSHIGMIVGSYTLAASVTGLVASTFLDRFDRRKALSVAMMGLGLATLAGGLAVGLWSLVGARVLAGIFGGPATSLSIAIVTDNVPPARRGRAMGAVMGAFSAASVLGVPAGLELSRLAGWRAPFLGVALLSAFITTTALLVMPPMKAHLERRRAALALGGPAVPAASLLSGTALLSLSATFLTMLGVFSIVPNLSAFLQLNLGYPRDSLWILYMVGGTASFVAMQITGRCIDRFGATECVVAGTLLHLTALTLAFLHPIAGVPIFIVFTAFMLSGGVRMVPMSSLSTRVPRPEQRAGFMSAQSSVQHAGSALGALASSAVLVSGPSGKLERMEVVAWCAFAVALVIPFLARRIEAAVRANEGVLAPPLVPLAGAVPESKA